MNRRIAMGMVLIVLFSVTAQAGLNRLGGGVHYWRALKDLDEPFDEDGLSWLVSYQLAPADLFRIEAALEIFPDGLLGAGDTAYGPQVFAILGAALYAGVGIGIYYAEEEWADDPFYVLRAGVDLEVIPDALHLDVYARYQFTDWDQLSEAGSDIDTDTVILGAAVRLEF